MRPILPYSLAFAAGAMIYVVVEELIPESHFEKHTDNCQKNQNIEEIFLTTTGVTQKLSMFKPTNAYQDIHLFSRRFY